MSFSRLSAIALLACGGLIAACAPDRPWLMEESTIVSKPLALVESRHIVKKPLSAIDAADVAEAARIYGKNGAGPMYVVIAYKDHGKINAGQAAAKSAALSALLQDHGVAARDIVASSVPLETDTPVALIAFDTLEARAPEGCEKTPGLNRRVVEVNDGYDYKLGCGIHDLMAKQIADPRDLEGRAGLGGRTDGEHAANVVTEQHRPGAPREYLPTYVISELADSGG